MRGLVVVGVDVGRTRIRIEARSRGRRIRSAQLVAVDLPELPAALHRMWRQWRLRPERIGAIVVASRGVWTRAEQRRVERRLGGLSRQVRVIPDAEAAWVGALSGGAGVLVLAGTGSIAVGRTAAGSWRRAGGLGPLLGDEGSAFWIGREWLRATNSDFATVRAIVHSPAPVARIASLAPRVLARARQGDRRATRIVRDAQAHLARLVVRLARTLRLEPPVRVSWAGSLLSRDDWFRAGLQRAVARSGLAARWVRPAERPVNAAARLAEALADAGPGRRGPLRAPASPAQPIPGERLGKGGEAPLRGSSPGARAQ